MNSTTKQITQLERRPLPPPPVPKPTIEIDPKQPTGLELSKTNRNKSIKANDRPRAGIKGAVKHTKVREDLKRKGKEALEKLKRDRPTLVFSILIVPVLGI